jgi:hypothetical protein
LAEARACSPSLFTIVVSCCSMMLRALSERAD